MMIVGLRPAAFGPGDLGPAAQDASTEQARRIVTALTDLPAAAGQAQTAQAVAPPGRASESAVMADRALPPELVSKQPLADGPDGESVPREIQREPAGPLKTYAQIPMEVVREITRLREEAAKAQIEGIPGRNDPTPMPARPEAIGARMPYDAA